MSQSTTNRRQQIMAQILDKKQVTVKALAASVGVSDATVRRDLKAMADEQGLKLFHGGASLPRERDFSFQAKLLRATEEKKIIGRLASQFAHDGDHIFLDSGTTCSELLPYLKKLHDITILANSARLALELRCVGSSFIFDGRRVSSGSDGYGWTDGAGDTQSSSRLRRVHRGRRFEQRFRTLGERSGQRPLASPGDSKRLGDCVACRPKQVRRRFAISDRRVVTNQHGRDRSAAGCATGWSSFKPTKSQSVFPTDT